MQIDFSSVEDVESFVTVPEGTYPCRIAEVRERLTREGHPRWAFRLEVADGDHAGRTAAWDSLVWSPRGLPRAKNVLAQLGFDVSGPLSVEPVELVDRCVRTELRIERHEDPQSGRTTSRLRVPYMGYQRLEENGQEPF
jgi:hypothetical protein